MHIKVKLGELEKALRMFKRKTDREGTFRRLKDRKFYKKPSVKKREKSKMAKKLKAKQKRSR